MNRQRLLAALCSAALVGGVAVAQPPREDGDRPERGQRDGERGQRGQRGERGPREGQRGPRGQRDGERGERPRPGDGERGPRGRADGRQTPPEGGRPPMGHPLMMLFDTDRDGEISAAEIAGADKVLLGMDRNGDGMLTPEEMPRPPRPDMDGPAGDRPERPDRPGRPGGDRPEGDRLDDTMVMQRLEGMDQDGDGKLSKEEAGPRLAPMFDRADGDGDGMIDQAELRRIIEMMMRRGEGGDRPGRPGAADQGGPDRAAMMVERLKTLDKDGDGKISKEEAPERMAAMFDRIDANADGVIDQAEMKTMADRFRGGPPAAGPGGDAGRRPREGGNGDRPDRPRRPGRDNDGDGDGDG